MFYSYCIKEHWEETMSLEQIKRDGIAFFTEAISKWNRLIELYKEIRASDIDEPIDEIREANEILAWFQDNYVKHEAYSNFRTVTTLPSGKKVSTDPIFDLVFRGSNIQNICSGWDPDTFAQDLNRGFAHLRGHLASIKNLTSPPKERDTETVPLLRVRKTVSRCNAVMREIK